MEETPLEEGKAVASPTSLKEEDAPLDEENAPEAAVAAASEEPFNGQEPPGSPEESSDQVPLTRDVGLETEMPSPSAEEQGKEGGSGEADVGGQEKDADAFEEGGEGDEEEDNAVAEEDDNAVAEEEVQERLEGKTGLDQGALFSETKSETDAQNAAHSPHSAQGLSDRSPSSRGSSQRSAESEEKAQLRGIVSQLEKELASLLRQTEEARASLAKAEEERHKAGARVASCLSCVPKTDPDARRSHRVLGGKGDAAVENETKAYLTRESYEQVLLQIARVETQTKPLETRLEQLKTRQEAQRLTHTEKATSCREAFREFVIQVGKRARMQQGGGPLKEGLVRQLLEGEAAEHEKLLQLRAEAQQLSWRIEEIQARSSHTTLASDDLPDGARRDLHAVDFEQLKMENQGLNEKLVERQEEAQKLQAIFRSAVQLLTHWREKLCFQEKENASEAQKLAALEEVLCGKREQVARLKRERAEARLQTEKLKQQSDGLNTERLAAAWDQKEQRISELRKEIPLLQKQLSDLTFFVADRVRHRNRRTTTLDARASRILLRHLKAPVETPVSPRLYLFPTGENGTSSTTDSAASPRE